MPWIRGPMRWGRVLTAVTERIDLDRDPLIAALIIESEAVFAAGDTT